VDSGACISVELRRPVENEVQNGNRDRGGKAHVSPENRIAGLKILTSKEVSYMRELAPEARSARDERLRNSWLRRAVPNVGPIYGPEAGQFPVNGTAGGGRRSGIASDKRISQHLSDWL
jgi:hypothetical protein